MELTYSFIVPVYNRPDEVKELLASFARFEGNVPHEIIIVEDGSTISSKEIVNVFKEALNIVYLEKENSGPGASRNYGMQRANGNYFIILDSDVVLPPKYLITVNDFLQRTYVDCFGGPDAAAQNFSAVQKAINFAMTSLLTTGGIRGNANGVKSYEPRSFNMGLSKKAFQVTKGFGKIHPGEDPELVIRLKKAGFKSVLIPEAFVFHKRRINWNKFYNQVHKFGKVRPILTHRYPASASIVFWFPSVFCIGLCLAFLGIFINTYFLLSCYFIYIALLFVVAAIQHKSIYLGLLSVRAVFTQFFGYGLGFLKATYYIRWLKKDPRDIFPDLFFK